MIKILVTILTLIIFYGCSAGIKWQTEYPDNFAEEYLEDIINDTTGIEIDLTPISGDETYIL